MEILVLANSPGEIAGWTRPVVHSLLKKDPGVKITVLLLPCSFSSGREREVAESIGGVNRVLGVGETLSLIFFGKNAGDFTGATAILHLGGDVFYSALLARRLKIPAYSYEWAQKMWDGDYTGYFARDEENVRILRNRGIDEKKIHVAGDLLVDSVFLRAEKMNLPEGRRGRLITLMPGSRMREAMALIPLFAGVARIIRGRFPETEFAMPVSPFIDMERFRSCFPLLPDSKIPGIRVDMDDGRLLAGDGVEISLFHDSFQVLPQTGFLLTIPGTTTGEAGTLGIPTLCILPLNRPELIPYIGIIGLLEYVPFIGKPLKGRIMMKLSEKKPLLAQPNLRAGRELIPEMMEVVNPEMIAEKIIPLLKEPEKLDEMSRELKALYAPYRGAGDRIAEIILSCPGQGN